MIIDWHSLLQIAVVVIGGLAFAAWIMAHLFLHVKPSGIESYQALAAEVGRGEPVLIYFYSNF